MSCNHESMPYTSQMKMKLWLMCWTEADLGARPSWCDPSIYQLFIRREINSFIRFEVWLDDSLGTLNLLDLKVHVIIECRVDCRGNSVLDCTVTKYFLCSYSTVRRCTASRTRYWRPSGVTRIWVRMVAV